LQLRETCFPEFGMGVSAPPARGGRRIVCSTSAAACARMAANLSSQLKQKPLSRGTENSGRLRSPLRKTRWPYGDICREVGTRRCGRGVADRIGLDNKFFHDGGRRSLGPRSGVVNVEQRCWLRARASGCEIRSSIVDAGETSAAGMQVTIASITRRDQ